MKIEFLKSLINFSLYTFNDDQIHENLLSIFYIIHENTSVKRCFFFIIVADPFSFQTTLHTNGTIVFAYKEVKFGQIGIIDVLSGLLVL